MHLFLQNRALISLNMAEKNDEVPRKLFIHFFFIF